jgi:hypothetical protein
MRTYRALVLEIMLAVLCHSTFAGINMYLKDMNMKAVRHIQSQRML